MTASTVRKTTGTWTFSAIVIFTVIVLLISVLAAVKFGPVDISFDTVYGIVLNKTLGVGSVAIDGEPMHDIVWLIRLPRVLLAVAIGMALAVSGVVMQAIVKNPLADPYILGVSSGATLGATAAIMLGVNGLIGQHSIGFFAFLGAVGVSFLVQIIANVGGQANSIRLLLGGLALSAACSAVSNFIIFMAHDQQSMGTLVFWLMGSLGGADWPKVLIILPIIVIAVLFFISQSRILNLMLLGDEAAITLGVDLHLYRQLYLIVSALMIGVSVYMAGMIGFVGLVIPHICRIIFGTDHSYLLIMSALTGAIFIIWADVACRILIEAGELPLGVLISLIGAPVFVYLMIKRTYGFGVN